MHRWTTLDWTQLSLVVVWAALDNRLAAPEFWTEYLPCFFEIWGVQQWKSRHVLDVNCVLLRCCDVSPVAVSVRKGPRHGGPRQTLFNSDVTTSRWGERRRGEFGTAGEHTDQQNCLTKDKKKSRSTIAVCDSRIKAATADSTLCHHHLFFFCLYKTTKQINEPGGSVRTEHSWQMPLGERKESIKQVPKLLSISALKK